MKRAKTCPLPKRNGETVFVTAYDGTHASVKRRRRSEYVMFKEGSTVRSRWGNKAQICEDIAAFKDTAELPGGKNRW